MKKYIFKHFIYHRFHEPDKMYCDVIYHNITRSPSPVFNTQQYRAFEENLTVCNWPRIWFDYAILFHFQFQLLLHRLANFQRVWSLAPNENTGKEITSLAWRPDGKSKLLPFEFLFQDVELKGRHTFLKCCSDPILSQFEAGFDVWILIWFPDVLDTCGVDWHSTELGLDLEKKT